MPQQPRPIGPTTNAAAPFIPSMVNAMEAPDRTPIRRVWQPPPLRSGVQVAQTTHVAAVFEPSMSQGWRPPQPRLFSTRNVLGLQIAQTTHVQAALEPAMSDGWMPDRNRERLPLRTGWSVSQTTHDTAPFGAEMADGWMPDRNRERLPLRTGQQLWAVEVPVFDVAMTQGWQPAAPRLFLAPRIPLPVSQTTPVSAPFSTEMADGSMPDRNRERLPLRTGLSLWVSDINTLSPDMTQGWHPDTARAFLAPRIPLPQSQPTHVDAPFSPEMAAGSQPVRSRDWLPLRQGFIAAAPDVQPFSVEMVVGSRPDSPRLFLAPRLTGSSSQPTHVNAAFTPSMVQGWHADAPQRLAVHAGIQVVHVMVLVVATDDGALSLITLPDRMAPGLKPRYVVHPQPLSQTTPVPVFSIEMTYGSKPDRAPRLLRGARIPLPVSQTTPIAAPFTPSMTYGSMPLRNRERLPLRTGWLFRHVSEGTTVVIYGSAPRTVNTDAQFGTAKTTNTDARFGVTKSTNTDAQFGTRFHANIDA